MPTSRFGYLDLPRPAALAHRGGAAERPENTMAAFEHAVGLGYRYLETDAQVTRDKQVIAFHDASLERVTGRRAAVADLTYDQIRQLRVDGEPIPLLEDVLLTWPGARVSLEAKQLSAVGPLAEVIRRTGSIDRVCVGSFHRRNLAAMRTELGDGLCTSLTTPDTIVLRVSSYVPLPLRPRGAVAALPVRYRGVPMVDARMVNEAHERGIVVHVWTIDDAQEMHRLLDLGVDGLMSDRPSLLKQVLEARGQWHT